MGCFTRYRSKRLRKRLKLGKRRQPTLGIYVVLCRSTLIHLPEVVSNPAEDQLEGFSVLATLRDGHVRVALRGLDEGDVHRSYRLVVLLADLIKGASAVLEIAAPSGRLGLGEGARARLLDPVAGTEGRTVGMVTAAFARATRGILKGNAPGHTGFTGTSMWLEPGAGAVMVLLTNRVHPDVPRSDFALVRRGFHRLASRLHG